MEGKGNSFNRKQGSLLHLLIHKKKKWRRRQRGTVDMLRPRQNAEGSLEKETRLTMEGKADHEDLRHRDQHLKTRSNPYLHGTRKPLIRF